MPSQRLDSERTACLWFRRQMSSPQPPSFRHDVLPVLLRLSRPLTKSKHNKIHRRDLRLDTTGTLAILSPQPQTIHTLPQSSKLHFQHSLTYDCHSVMEIEVLVRGKEDIGVVAILISLLIPTRSTSKPINGNYRSHVVALRPLIGKCDLRISESGRYSFKV